MVLCGAGLICAEQVAVQRSGGRVGWLQAAYSAPLYPVSPFQYRLSLAVQVCASHVELQRERARSIARFTHALPQDWTRCIKSAPGSHTLGAQHAV